ncbi:MAG: hypothetical protein ACYC1D_14750, partial [Acidimicrobiales bacterium]
EGVGTNSDQVTRWLYHWKRELVLTGTKVRVYRTPSEDWVTPGAGTPQVSAALIAIGFTRVSLRALDARARARRESGADLLAGRRWDPHGAVYSAGKLVVVGGGPTPALDWPPPAAVELDAGVWDLGPAAIPAMAFAPGDADLCGVDTLGGEVPTSIRFGIDYDTFDGDGSYEKVGELDLRSGLLWLARLREAPADAWGKMRPGVYAVEVWSTPGGFGLRLRWSHRSARSC